MKRNDGFTLVELIVTIMAASIVTAAAATVLLFALRVNNESSKTASQQNTANIVLTVLGDLAAEEQITLTPNPGEDTVDWSVQKTLEDKSTVALFSYNATKHTINLGASADSPLMSNVTASASLSDENTLTLKIVTEDGTEYTTTVYCRLVPPPADASASYRLNPRLTPETDIDLTPDLSNVSHAEGREAFLSVLTSEEGSTGYSLTTGEYFSEWYIGSYEDNPSWNQQTPWCACFISWALEQCSEYLNEVPKYAHVDKFMASFNRSHRKTVGPETGDIIFFDWIENEVSYPQHVGVVVTVKDGYVYTIEGNADGKVASRVYALDDPYILGYGVLDWK